MENSEALDYLREKATKGSETNEEKAKVGEAICVLALSLLELQDRRLGLGEYDGRE